MKKISILIVLFILNFLFFNLSYVFASSQDNMSEMRDMASKDLAVVSDAMNNLTDIPPIPDNYKKILEDGIRKILKDPESARFRYAEDIPKYCVISNRRDKRSPMAPITLVSDSPLFGYSGVIFVNAKNSFGGYTGEQPYWYMISNGKLSLLKEVSSPTNSQFKSLFREINSIDDIELSPLNWGGNQFRCVNK